MARLAFIRIYVGSLASLLLKGSRNKIYVNVIELFSCTNNSSETKDYVTSFNHSLSILSDDRSKASSKTMPPHSAI